MVAKEDIIQLKTKILPVGAESVLDYLATHNDQVEITHILIENVPLLIIGRHGMILRMAKQGGVRKSSQGTEILVLLRDLISRQETLYLFVNLPDLPVPNEVLSLLEEAQYRASRREQLTAMIDSALDAGDSDMFYRVCRELESLTTSKTHAKRF